MRKKMSIPTKKSGLFEVIRIMSPKLPCLVNKPTVSEDYVNPTCIQEQYSIVWEYPKSNINREHLKF